MEKEILAILGTIAPYVEIHPNTKLLEEGILDSIGMILLINELEKTYAIAIPLERLKAEDFATITDIASLVKRLL